jgi:hypothetical protein
MRLALISGGSADDATDARKTTMSRLEQLRFKVRCSSYGPRLTPLEELELFQLEDEEVEDRIGHLVDPSHALRAGAPDSDFSND